LIDIAASIASYNFQIDYLLQNHQFVQCLIQEINMELSGDRIKELREALQSAFPDRPKLKQLVLEELDRNLDEIVGDGNLTESVAELINFAVAEGQIVELMTAANRRNPGNSKLRLFVESCELSPFEEDEPDLPQGNVKISHKLLRNGLYISVGATLAISLSRFLGVLQPLELKAYDLVMRSRSLEFPDKEVLVIKVIEKDEPKRGKNEHNNTLSDERLEKLLKLILPLEPKIIGFDNYLNHKIDPKYKTIRQSLESGDLVAVCESKDGGGEEFNPPEGATWFGFGDIIHDNDDKIVRRHLLSMGNVQSSYCKPPYALSTLLANRYLENTDKKLDLPFQLDRSRIGSNYLFFLNDRIGGYQNFDSGGYQIMLNYRRTNFWEKPPLNWDNSIPINDILKALLPKLTLEIKDRIQGRIVLIGTSESNDRPGFKKDIHETPYGSIPGVFLQAQMTSQLVNAALYQRPLIWAYPSWVEIPMILLASVTGALLSWRVRKVWIVLCCGGGVIAILFFGSRTLLTRVGYWFPLIPVGLGFTIVCICVTFYLCREKKPA
jgi:CHASE2 domain-containing sensor protein